MNIKSKDALRKITLISTPWPLYSRPSIQLGTLKAFLQTRIPEMQIDAFHFYLSIAEAIGYRLYHEISQRSWLAESVYAALLYPERIKQAEALFCKESTGNSILRQVRFKTLTEQIKRTTDAFLSRRKWETYGLLGFSISICQLTSALYMIRRLKKRFPDLMVVVGGALTAGVSAHGILQKFPEVDVAVNGEGEMPLYQIIQHLRQKPSDLNLSKIHGVCTRFNDTEQPDKPSFSQLKALDELAAPDYDDYFGLLKSFDAPKFFFPTLPVEISRGCWWKRAVESTKVTGCAFCNLNLQWEGYRCKPVSQAVAEIDYLTDRYQTLSVAIMDNVLPKKKAIDIFLQVAGLNKDLRLFGEVRATTPFRELKAMRNCGMREVQIGIEALCSRLLKKLHKGTSAIQNLEMMKNCEALGIRNISNLILYFPGSTQQDVAETLSTLEFTLPFQPLRAVSFWLGLESPVWQHPEKFGIRAVFNHPNYAFLFPEEIHRTWPLMIQAYRGDLTYQKQIWRPVKKRISDWQKQYAEMLKGPGDKPILSYRDGKDFMIIRQKRFRAEPSVHRLVGASREIYLLCQKHRSVQTIFAAFPDIPGDTIVNFLNMMVDKKLMFAEKNKYLSLASAVN
ncbi:MAG: RiPP maturation radical SAM C-methyltransferase [Desulfobacteraceae bacterium]|jgi:ribosomal peptide maturation radical SAM protein 1